LVSDLVLGLLRRLLDGDLAKRVTKANEIDHSARFIQPNRPEIEVKQKPIHWGSAKQTNTASGMTGDNPFFIR
jgi:hypothetical protein